MSGTLRSTCALLAAVSLLVFGTANRAAADSMTLLWDVATGDVGYKVHVGMQSGSYSQHYDVGSSTSFTFSTAAPGQRYCFTVSAYLQSSLVEGPNSNEVCGYSNRPPTLTNPGSRTSTVGQAVTLQLQGSDPDGQPVSYSASGLPPGLSLMASTGFISGNGTTAGTYTVTANVNDGVLSATPQVFTWSLTAAPDTTRPTASIATPTSAATFSTTGSTINLGGGAADNMAVTQVRWANDRGGSGMANGTTSWNVSGMALQTGTNVITITALDAAGNTGTAALTVTRTTTPSDTTLPTASIVTPTTGPTFSTTFSTINLTGNAADNVGVTQVRWANDRGGDGVASGTTSWAIGPITLATGTNIITVTAFDAAGNPGTDTLTVTYSGTTTPSPAPPLPPPSGAALTVSTLRKTATLRWSNTSGWTNVNIYRNGTMISSFSANDGVHSDSIGRKGTYTYKVCEPGPESTAACTNSVSVTF